jgi:hypothetical protein
LPLHQVGIEPSAAENTAAIVMQATIAPPVKGSLGEFRFRVVIGRAPQRYLG